MSIALKPEQQQFIQQQIALGRFGSEEEVFEKALQLLSSQYREYDEWVEDTRAKIDEAQAEIDRVCKQSAVALGLLCRVFTSDFPHMDRT
jgi:antitoxin ParD1/3/4